MAETREVAVRGGIKTEAVKKPFWVSEEEKRGVGYTPHDNLDVAAAVPQLTWLEKGSVIGAFVIKDGLVVYHIYKKDRKQIYDDAQEQLRNTSDARAQEAIARQANQALHECPWWPEMVEKLQIIFQEHFKHQPHKISYYPEVDSWSVILPVPNMPTARTDAYLAGPISRLALLVEG